jgi:hypothetical protein
MRIRRKGVRKTLHDGARNATIIRVEEDDGRTIKDWVDEKQLVWCGHTL